MLKRLMVKQKVLLGRHMGNDSTQLTVNLLSLQRSRVFTHWFSFPIAFTFTKEAVISVYTNNGNLKDRSFTSANWYTYKHYVHTVIRFQFHTIPISIPLFSNISKAFRSGFFFRAGPDMTSFCMKTFIIVHCTMCCTYNLNAIITHQIVMI